MWRNIIYGRHYTDHQIMCTCVRNNKVKFNYNALQPMREFQMSN